MLCFCLKITMELQKKNDKISKCVVLQGNRIHVIAFISQIKRPTSCNIT